MPIDNRPICLCGSPLDYEGQSCPDGCPCGTVTNRVVCAWCGLLLQDGEEPISHGICEPCAAKLEAT